MTDDTSPIDRLRSIPLPRMSKRKMQRNGQKSQMMARAKRVPITLPKVGKEKTK